MGLKNRLIIMNFLQFFIWGSWLLTIGAYWFQNKNWSGTEFGAIFSTMGLASLFMPAIAGIIADRWVNAERLYGIFHICGAVMLSLLPAVKSPDTFFWVMLLTMMFYMPTIALAITVAYSSMKNKGMDIIRDYPPIRVWGTIGFIVALWVVSLSGFETSSLQFYVAAAASLGLGIYAFTLPKCPPLGGGHKKSLVETMGLNAFKLFRSSKMALFFIFAMLLGAALQLTNAYGDTFLHDFAKIDCIQGSHCREIPGNYNVNITDIRNAFHPDNSVFPQTVRYKESHAHEHGCMDSSFRALRPWQSGRRTVDDSTLVYYLRDGFRLLQYFRFALRGDAECTGDQGQCPGSVHDDDKRLRRIPWKPHQRNSHR